MVNDHYPQKIGCVWKCRVPHFPNGFADQTIPIFYGYFIGKINPIFRQTQVGEIQT